MFLTSTHWVRNSLICAASSLLVFLFFQPSLLSKTLTHWWPSPSPFHSSFLSFSPSPLLYACLLCTPSSLSLFLFVVLCFSLLCCLCSGLSLSLSACLLWTPSSLSLFLLVLWSLSLSFCLSCGLFLSLSHVACPLFAVPLHFFLL